MAMLENATQLPDDFVAGNCFDKYGSKNPIHKALMRGFLRAASKLVRYTRISTAYGTPS
jgi:hypothetical protein